MVNDGSKNALLEASVSYHPIHSSVSVALFSYMVYSATLVPPKYWYLSTRLQGGTAMRTSSLTSPLSNKGKLNFSAENTFSRFTA
jgi:hypothetical protein